ncbi:protein PXR1 [Selaginella moellendorffii]|uniref:protein PXR1 n=1 Tax=Selaginella moellendorffii TaxID=88036 RepID=UPI000D1CD52E|nr:protein PXR1 [Selaginella moellendorffii]|eukprot:XP_024536366.1 protein PXR1 [Selaginella moellendorffii]
MESPRGRKRVAYIWLGFLDRGAWISYFRALDMAQQVKHLEVDVEKKMHLEDSGMEKKKEKKEKKEKSAEVDEDHKEKKKEKKEKKEKCVEVDEDHKEKKKEKK